MAHLLRRRLDQEGWDETVFEGQIVSLTRRGMFVLFDRLFQGYLSTRELPHDYYELNELETVLEGRRTGLAYKVADLVSVRVTAVDEVRGRVDVALAGEAEGDVGLIRAASRRAGRRPVACGQQERPQRGSAQVQDHPHPRAQSRTSAAGARQKVDGRSVARVADRVRMLRRPHGGR